MVAHGCGIARPLINDKSLKYNYTNEGGVGGNDPVSKEYHGTVACAGMPAALGAPRKDYGLRGTDCDGRRRQAARALINPDDAPFGLPGEMPAKIDDFCRQTGQTAPDSIGACIRTCLESLALTYRKTLEGLEDILGRRINVIHIVRRRRAERAAVANDRRCLWPNGRCRARRSDRNWQHTRSGDGDR